MCTKRSHQGSNVERVWIAKFRDQLFLRLDTIKQPAFQPLQHQLSLCDIRALHAICTTREHVMLRLNPDANVSVESRPAQDRQTPQHGV